MQVIEYPSFARNKSKRIKNLAVAFLISGVLLSFCAVHLVFLWIPASFGYALFLKCLQLNMNPSQGQRGEDKTARVLSVLGDEYILFRNFKPSQRNGDIDFILLGPFGALVLEQKTLSVPLACIGDTWKVQVSPTYWKSIKSYSRQLKRNQEVVTRILGYPCLGAIVLNDSISLDVSDPIVPIIRRRDLLAFIYDLPPMNGDVKHFCSRLQQSVAA